MEATEDLPLQLPLLVAVLHVLNYLLQPSRLFWWCFRLLVCPRRAAPKAAPVEETPAEPEVVAYVPPARNLRPVKPYVPEEPYTDEHAAVCTKLQARYRGKTARQTVKQKKADREALKLAQQADVPGDETSRRRSAYAEQWQASDSPPNGDVNGPVTRTSLSKASRTSKDASRTSKDGPASKRASATSAKERPRFDTAEDPVARRKVAAGEEAVTVRGRAICCRRRHIEGTLSKLDRILEVCRCPARVRGLASPKKYAWLLPSLGLEPAAEVSEVRKTRAGRHLSAEEQALVRDLTMNALSGEMVSAEERREARLAAAEQLFPDLQGDELEAEMALLEQEDLAAAAAEAAVRASQSAAAAAALAEEEDPVEQNHVHQRPIQPLVAPRPGSRSPPTSRPVSPSGRAPVPLVAPEQKRPAVPLVAPKSPTSRAGFSSPKSPADPHHKRMSLEGLAHGAHELEHRAMEKAHHLRDDAKKGFSSLFGGGRKTQNAKHELEAQRRAETEERQRQASAAAERAAAKARADREARLAAEKEEYRQRSEAATMIQRRVRGTEARIEVDRKRLEHKAELKRKKDELLKQFVEQHDAERSVPSPDEARAVARTQFSVRAAASQRADVRGSSPTREASPPRRRLVSDTDGVRSPKSSPGTLEIPVKRGGLLNLPFSPFSPFNGSKSPSSPMSPVSPSDVVKTRSRTLNAIQELQGLLLKSLDEEDKCLLAEFETADDGAEQKLSRDRLKAWVEELLHIARSGQPAMHDETHRAHASHAGRGASAATDFHNAQHVQALLTGMKEEIDFVSMLNWWQKVAEELSPALLARRTEDCAWVVQSFAKYGSAPLERLEVGCATYARWVIAASRKTSVSALAAALAPLNVQLAQKDLAPIGDENDVRASVPLAFATLMDALSPEAQTVAVSFLDVSEGAPDLDVKKVNLLAEQLQTTVYAPQRGKMSLDKAILDLHDKHGVKKNRSLRAQQDMRRELQWRRWDVSTCKTVLQRYAQSMTVLVTAFAKLNVERAFTKRGLKPPPL